MSADESDFGRRHSVHAWYRSEFLQTSLFQNGRCNPAHAWYVIAVSCWHGSVLQQTLPSENHCRASLPLPECLEYDTQGQSIRNRAVFTLDMNDRKHQSDLSWPDASHYTFIARHITLQVAPAFPDILQSSSPPFLMSWIFLPRHPSVLFASFSPLTRISS